MTLSHWSAKQAAHKASKEATLAKFKLVAPDLTKLKGFAAERSNAEQRSR